MAVVHDDRASIATHEIGELIMNGLKLHDTVAFIRFASVYRDFKDVREFKAELEQLLNAREQKTTVKAKSGSK